MRIAIAGVVGDFLPQPIRFLEGLVFRSQFYLGDSQPLVVPIKFIHLKNMTLERNDVTGLVNDTAPAKP